MALEDLETNTLDIKNEGEMQSLETVEAMLPGPLPRRWAQYLVKNPRPAFFSARIDPVGSMSFLAGDPVDVTLLYALNTGNLGLSKIYKRYNGRVMQGFVPLASPGPNGDCIFYGMGPAGLGKVFYWWHEGPGPENSAESLCLLAHSLDDFFDRLEQIPEDEL